MRGFGGEMRVGDTLGNAHAQVLALAPGVVATSLALDPTAGYVLSRIDGRTSWGTLRQIGALPPHEVDRLVERWLKDGVLVASAARAIRSSSEPDPSAAAHARESQRESTARDAKPSADAKPAAPAPITAKPRALELPDVDASLELEPELQREILAFAAGLGRRYHEILGVAADADTRAIKRAYFALSKKLHPDRYFRRNTGAFAPLIETCFKRLLEAYELLSDPTARKEVQAAESAPRISFSAGEAASARERGLAARRRLRERVSAMSSRARAEVERRRKAKTFFEHGMSAFAASRWLEAAGAVRLAIAFDPDNSAYREEFPSVQRKAHEERAKQLVKHADSALEMRDYEAALEHFEEALHYRPGDAELAYRAARVAVQSSADLKLAKEFASQAVEVAPDKAEYRTLLASVYAAAGLTANAKREFGAALRLDPNDKEAKAGLRALG